MKVVVCRLFGGVEEAVGRRLELNFVEFTILQVVRDEHISLLSRATWNMGTLYY